ncbi:hypothetical protein PCL_08566 [Purpureocillium lilacinum]|uniref:DUF7707 domain-containing protein n=2 Tax=Purpureocillium lilacinum TaxID=33203 RepID=A0A2U3DR91_PURLI|nr:hypothetical protein PCL_08566 [Purpureocillium lilacinum]
MYKYEYKYIFAPSPAGLLAEVVPSRLPCAKPSGAETGNIRFRMAHRRAFHARPLPHSLTHSRTHSARRFQQKHHHPGTTLAHSHTKPGRPPAAHLPTTFLGLGCRPNLSLLSLSRCNLSLFSSLASRTATRNTPSSIASETASATASTHPRLSDCISDSSSASIRLRVPPQSLDTHFSPSNSLTSPAMRASAALVAFAAAAVSAQQNYTSELDMKIDPNTVQLQIRAQWCQAQTNTCNLLCNNDTDKNSCAQEDLKYECTCASNSSAPGLQYYTQTMPTFICDALFGQCNEQNVGNADGQKACTTNIKNLCGKNDPPKAPVSDESSSSVSGTPSATGSASATGSKASTTSTSTGLAAPTMAPAGNGAAAAAAIGLLAYLI